MMSQIHRTAPLLELLRLKKDCYVYIGVGGEAAPAATAEVKEFLRVNFPGAKWLRGCHDKSLSIYAPNSSGVWGNYTIAGSHNWTLSALRQNDELLTVTNNLGVYNADVDHFNDLWTKGTALNP